MQVTNEKIKQAYYAYAKKVGMINVILETEAWANSMEDYINLYHGIPIGVQRFHELPAEQARIAISFLIDCWVKNNEFREAIKASRISKMQ